MKLPQFPMDKIKKKQTTLLWGTVALLTVSIGAILLIFVRDNVASASPQTSYKSDITTGTSRINSQEVWMEQMKIENETQKKRLEAMEKVIETLVKFKEPQRIDERGGEQHQINTLTTQGGDDIEALQQELHEKVIESPKGPAVNAPTALPIAPDTTTLAGTVINEATKFRSKGIHRISINLPQSRANKPLKTIDNYTPSGSFAPAVVLTGVDASTSVQASGNPKPALLQIMGEAILPGGHKADLKGCHVTTEAIGDLSSERAEIRLEKLSCVEQKTGEVIELNVKGYLAGSDSKAG